MTMFFSLFQEAADAGLSGGGGGAVAAPAVPANTGGAAPALREQILQSDGQLTPGWHAHLGGEFKDAGAQLSRFKTFPDVVKSLLHGQRQLSQARPQVPNEKSTPEQIRAYRDYVGLPEDERAWDIARPEALPTGVEWNEDLAKGVSQWARTHHIPPQAVGKLVETFNNLTGTQSKAAYDKFMDHSLATVQADEVALKREWGDDYGRNLSLARRAAATAGLSADHYALTDKDVVKALHKLAVATGEGRLVPGMPSPLTGDPRTQANQIQTDAAHPHYAAYHNPQHPNHRATRSLVLNLLQQNGQ